MRRVMTRLERRAEPAQQALLRRLELEQRGRGNDPCMERFRPRPAKGVEALDLNPEGAPAQTRERLGDVSGRGIIDVADEAEGDVIGLRFDPARAGQAAAHQRKPVADLARHLDGGEQTGHGTIFGTGFGLTRSSPRPQAQRGHTPRVLAPPLAGGASLSYRSAMVPALASFRRIVVKIGSSLLVDRDKGRLRHGWLASLADDLARHAARGAEIIVVSSGAIALGRTVLTLPKGPLALEASQAAAAVGQIALAHAWSDALGARGLTAAQVLVTLGDTEERRRYLNARNTLAKLLELKCVPVVNENDTVATSEIRYGDNDRLAARVATMAAADCLVLLSDIDGLYTAPPGSDPAARLLPVVPRITAEIEAMAGDAGSELSRGGMRTKVEAAKIAVGGGTAMVIASGKVEAPLAHIEAGAPCTWFLTTSNPLTARKKWLAGHLEPRGALHVDAGAAAALRGGASLLPAGVTRVEGSFARGDAVVIRDPAGAEVGRGIVAYDVGDAVRIAGRRSRAIEEVLGFRGRVRDDPSRRHGPVRRPGCLRSCVRAAKRRNGRRTAG